MNYFNKLLKMYLFLFFLTLIFVFSNLSAQEIIQNTTQPESQPAEPLEPQQVPKPQPQFVGELFGVQVPLDNYIFVQGALTIFGNKFGPQPTNDKERENYIWDQLLLSYEAFRRGTNVSREEVEQEVDKILKENEVEFDWKKEKEAYGKWAKEKVNTSTTFFENILNHLLQIQKLREQVMASIEPAVSEKEAFDEFVKEYNSLGVELVKFDQEKDAEKFYRQAKANPKFWDEEKTRRPGDFKRPGFVSTEFLIDVWKFPKEDVYMIIKEKIGNVYKPFRIYKGYAVAKILEKRPAEKKQFVNVKNSYYEQIKRRKRYEVLDQWFKDLKKQANIKIYPVTDPGLPEKKNEISNGAGKKEGEGNG